MKFDVRLANPEDDAFVIRLITETITLELGASDWPEPLKKQVIPLQVNARSAAVRGGFPGGQSLILQLAGEDVGWLYFARLDAEVRLVDLMVANRARRNGAGTAAVRHVIAFAGGLPVRLHVRVLNTGARRLYERLGFRRIGGDEVNLLMEHPGATPC